MIWIAKFLISGKDFLMPFCQNARCATMLGIAAIWTFSVDPSARASTVDRFYEFPASSHNAPSGVPIFDSAGNLYCNVYTFIGEDTYGAVIELSPPTAGQTGWKRKNLYSFTQSDLAIPIGHLIMDSAGHLYGSAWGQQLGQQSGASYVFKLTPPSAGHTVWTRSTVHVLENVFEPDISIMSGGTGTIYGTGLSGTIFALTPPDASKSLWTETVLHQFSGTFGSNLNAGLIADANGNLYGTTESGGSYNLGRVFELSPPSSGSKVWKETTLYSFPGNVESGFPWGPLVADGNGALYGGAFGSGSNGHYGLIYKLTPPAAGHTIWTKSVIYDFANGSQPQNGAAGPWGAMVFDQNGALYGTSQEGGYGRGTIFKLTPPADGKGRWSETVLYNLPFDTFESDLVAGPDYSIYGYLKFQNSEGPAGSLFRIIP